MNKTINTDIDIEITPTDLLEYLVETDHFILNSPIGNIIYIRLEKYQEMRVQQDWWNTPYKKVRESNIGN